jgi:hypothetical protein
VIQSNKLIGTNKNRGVIPRSSLYSYLSKFSRSAIESLVDLMKHTSNESVKLGCIRLLLDKTIPDLKPIEEKMNDTELNIHIVAEKTYYSQVETNSPESK